MARLVVAGGVVAAAVLTEPRSRTWPALLSAPLMQACPLAAGRTSMSTGQPCCSATSRAAAVALYTARTSPPSTRTLGMPYAGPRPAMPSPALEVTFEAGAKRGVFLYAGPRPAMPSPSAPRVHAKLSTEASALEACHCGVLIAQLLIARPAHRHQAAHQTCGVSAAGTALLRAQVTLTCCCSIYTAHGASPTKFSQGLIRVWARLGAVPWRMWRRPSQCCGR